MAVEYDEIGIWSEVKLAIVREYAAAYSKIMEGTRRDRINRLSWIYIDAYAGPGYHLSKTTGETVEGSPLIALNSAQNEQTVFDAWLSTVVRGHASIQTDVAIS